jgi:hypothetical protein
VDKLEDLARDDPSVRQQLRELLDSEDPLTVALRARVRGALTYWFMDEADLLEGPPLQLDTASPFLIVRVVTDADIARQVRRPRRLRAS